jgi:hypothetical protein
MDASTTTFAQLAHDVAVKHVPAAAIDGALASLGGKGEWSVYSMDPDRRSALVSHFVRSLRNVGVHTASRVEAALLAAAGCRPLGCRVIVLKDAISLITVRNQIHQLITSLGAGWSGSMRYQSALSDIARFVIERGGGRIELEDAPGHIVFLVHTAEDIGPISTTPGSAPAWLAATLNLTKEVRFSRLGSGSVVEIKFPAPKALVA